MTEHGTMTEQRDNDKAGRQLQSRGTMTEQGDNDRAWGNDKAEGQ